MRCAIYARFSSDRQNAASAEDQVRLCREYAEREGWSVVAVHEDHAISGATDRRPGMTTMLSQVAAGAYDVVLAEALDRFGRDLGDLDRMRKRLVFAGVQFVTLADGRVNELHVGLKGTMAALELKNIGARTRRGQLGSLARGRVPGSRAYGYDVTPLIHPGGRIEKGRRRINEDQARVVRRIFDEYLRGLSPLKIAKALNVDGITSPGGGLWSPRSIIGTGGRGTGILCNTIYIGEFVYGRVKGVQDPDTRKRLWRVTPDADRVVQAMPELAIVDRKIWDAVQAARAARAGVRLPRRKRPRLLLSGLVECGLCGSPFTVFGGDRWCCSRRMHTGACTQQGGISTAKLEARVLTGLQERLLCRDTMDLMVREYHEDRARTLKADAVDRARLEARVAAADRAIGRLVIALTDGEIDVPELAEALIAKREDRAAAIAAIGELEAPSVIALHPAALASIRQRIEALTSSADREPGSDTFNALRAFIERIVVMPGTRGNPELEVIGSLQAAITGEPSKSPLRTDHRSRTLQVHATVTGVGRLNRINPRRDMMKKLIISAVLAATAMTGLSVSVPATAQPTTYERQQYNYQQAMRDYRRETRNYRQWNRYDYNNPDPRYGSYYADRYYRDGRYYRQRQLSQNDRVYRGYDGRYYCRRSDGTTGLILGAGVGALFGNAIDNGRSSVLGTLLGAAAGGAIGNSIDRNSRRNVYCR